MKKGFSILTAVLALVLVSCSKDDGDLLYMEPCGILLPIAQEYLDKGLTVDSYGTDMAVYPVTIIGFSYPQAMQEIYSEASSRWENLDSDEAQEAFYNELQQKMSVHQKLIGELAVIPTKEYKSLMENPQAGYEFITDMKVVAKKHGNTYLFSQIENTTDGMSEEEEQIFFECRDHALDAVKNARYKKISIEKNTGTPRMDEGLKFPMFASLDLDGNSVTEQIFGRNDLTVLLLWNHADKKCADFVKEFTVWSGLLPKNVQTVGLVCDINSPADQSKMDGAKKIADDAFTNIIAAGELQSVDEYFNSLPVVMLVDSDGNLWGRPVENPSIDDCAELVALWMEAASRHSDGE